MNEAKQRQWISDGNDSMVQEVAFHRKGALGIAHLKIDEIQPVSYGLALCCCELGCRLLDVHVQPAEWGRGAGRGQWGPATREQDQQRS